MIISTIKKLLTEAPFLAIFVVFWAGAIASLSSCTIARIPVVVGYVAGASDSRKKAMSLSAFFILGLIVSYTLLGILFAMISNLPGRLIFASKYMFWVLGALVLLMGIIISGFFDIKISNFQHSISNKFKNAGYLGTLIFGMSFAFLEMPACPCCGSILLIIAGIVVIKGSLLYSLAIFLSFAVGQSFPIFLIASSTGFIKYLVPKVAKLEGYIKLIAGNILIVLGIYFIIIA